jgi:excisionase family DNA binding protein
MTSAWLTPSEVAEELRCSDDSVLAAIKRGDLEAMKYGRLVRISREALDAFLAANSTARRGLRSTA